MICFVGSLFLDPDAHAAHSCFLGKELHRYRFAGSGRSRSQKHIHGQIQRALTLGCLLQTHPHSLLLHLARTFRGWDTNQSTTCWAVPASGKRLIILHIEKPRKSSDSTWTARCSLRCIGLAPYEFLRCGGVARHAQLVHVAHQRRLPSQHLAPRSRRPE